MLNNVGNLASQPWKVHEQTLGGLFLFPVKFVLIVAFGKRGIAEITVDREDVVDCDKENEELAGDMAEGEEVEEEAVEVEAVEEVEVEEEVEEEEVEEEEELEEEGEEGEEWLNGSVLTETKDGWEIGAIEAIEIDGMGTLCPKIGVQCRRLNKLG